MEKKISKEELDALLAPFQEGSEVADSVKEAARELFVSTKVFKTDRGPLRVESIDFVELFAYAGFDPDLSGMDLSPYDPLLSGANLHGFNLLGADMEDMDLSFADLSRANIHKANMEGTDQEGINLEGAIRKKISPGEFLHLMTIFSDDLSIDEDLKQFYEERYHRFFAVIEDNQLSIKKGIDYVKLFTEHGYPLDLSGLDPDKDYSEVERQGAELLQQVIQMVPEAFFGANLQGFDLSYANFGGTVSIQDYGRMSAEEREGVQPGTHFAYADLRGANVQGAHFEYTNLHSAKVDGQFWQGTKEHREGMQLPSIWKNWDFISDIKLQDLQAKRELLDTYLIKLNKIKQSDHLHDITDTLVNFIAERDRLGEKTFSQIDVVGILMTVFNVPHDKIAHEEKEIMGKKGIVNATREQCHKLVEALFDYNGINLRSITREAALEALKAKMPEEEGKVEAAAPPQASDAAEAASAIRPQQSVEDLIGIFQREAKKAEADAKAAGKRAEAHEAVADQHEAKAGHYAILAAGHSNAAAEIIRKKREKAAQGACGSEVSGGWAEGHGSRRGGATEIS